MSTMLFSYKTTYKITIGYILYQLVYGLHPLRLIQYIIPIIGGNERKNILVRALIGKIIKLEKLQEARMQVAKIVRIQQWNKTLWSQQKNPKK